jgi:hypothetical protein
MARTTKYDWPDDQKLQALLDEHGTVETARLVGCPPSSLSSRIRQRGLQGSGERRKPDETRPSLHPFAPIVNGRPDAANGKKQLDVASIANGEPDAVNRNEKPAAAGPGQTNGNEKPAAARPGKEPVREQKPSGEPAQAGGPHPDSRRAPSPARADEKLRGQKPQQQLERLGSADYLRRRKLRKPAEIVASSGNAPKDRIELPPAAQEARQNPANEPGGDPPPAQSPPRSKRRGPAFLRRVPPLIWRSLAVVCLAAVAGIAAFLSVSKDPKTYERESSFAVRPSATVPPAAVNDVLGTLAQPDSAITETIVNMLGSPRLSSFAAQSAGLPPESVGASGGLYEWSATRRPGSTIIDIRLTGPDDSKLLAMQTAAAPEAARLVEASYPPYLLETLSAPSPPVQVGPKIARTVGFAVMLGALLGITLVLVERRLRLSVAQRNGPSRAPAERGTSWER